MLFVSISIAQNSSIICKYSYDENDEVSIIISINGNAFTAIYSEFIGDGGWDKYLTGNFEKGIANCKILGCRNTGFSGDDGSSYSNIQTDCGKMVLYLAQNKSILNIDNPDPVNNENGWQLKLLKQSIDVPLTDVRNVREMPSISSKIISKIDFGKIKLELLQIGPFEKIGTKIGFWYKIKIENSEGWVYGG